MAYADGARKSEPARPRPIGDKGRPPEFDRLCGRGATVLKPPPLDLCGMARAADLVGDRWTLLIIREALYGVTRFDAMRADLDIPRTVLSARLKRLCAHGLLTKRAYREPGQRTRFQYVLTSKGVDLAVAMIALMQWGDKNLPGAAPRTQIVDRKTGGLCRVGLVAENGDAVGVGETKIRIAN
jgi:DNA-binding HxlR family transcriptional regulator